MVDYHSWPASENVGALAIAGVILEDVITPGVSDRQLCLMAGNACSINVVARILLKMIGALGLAPKSVRKQLSDPYK